MTGHSYLFICIPGGYIILLKNTKNTLFISRKIKEKYFRNICLENKEVCSSLKYQFTGLFSGRLNLGSTIFALIFSVEKQMKQI